MPEPTTDDPASRLAVIEIPGRFETPQVADDGSVVLTQGRNGLTYEIRPLGPGVIEPTVPVSNTQTLYVTPLARYEVEVVGPSCETRFAFRARAVGEVLDLGTVACGAKGQLSAEPGQPVPFLNFDLSEDRSTLAIHDGVSLFLVDANESREVAEAAVAGPPQWVGESVVFASASGTGIYDSVAGTELLIPAQYGNFRGASAIAKTALFDREGGGLVVYSWANGVEEVWTTDLPTAAGQASLDPTGTRVAYFTTTNQTTYVDDLEESADSVSFGQNGGQVIFALDGSGEVLLDGTFVRSPVTSFNGETFAVAPGSGKLLVAAASGLSMYETGPQMVRGVDISLPGAIDRAEAVGDKMVLRIGETTEVIDVETETRIATYEGRWRGWRLTADQLLLITFWDLPFASQDPIYPVCSPPATSCTAVVIDSNGAEQWTGEVTTGVPFGADLLPRFNWTAPRQDDGCIPVEVVTPDGEVIPTEGDFCHVQSMPDRFFGIPCLPHAWSTGAQQGVYCAY